MQAAQIIMLSVACSNTVGSKSSSPLVTRTSHSELRSSKKSRDRNEDDLESIVAIGKLAILLSVVDFTGNALATHAHYVIFAIVVIVSYVTITT